MFENKGFAGPLERMFLVKHFWCLDDFVDFRSRLENLRVLSEDKDDKEEREEIIAFKDEL